MLKLVSSLRLMSLRPAPLSVLPSRLHVTMLESASAQRGAYGHASVARLPYYVLDLPDRGEQIFDTGAEETHVLVPEIFESEIEKTRRFSFPRGCNRST